jgi:hypothetical protein
MTVPLDDGLPRPDSPPSACDLPQRSVLLSLQEVTEDLASIEPERFPTDADEAAALLDHLLRAEGLITAGDAASRLLDDDAVDEASAVARRVLQHLLEDPDTAGPTRDVVADPPKDTQLSVDSVVVGAVVLAALVAWLQTKVDLRIRRRHGTTEFDFHLTNKATGTGTLRRVASVVAALLTGPPPPQ